MVNVLYVALMILFICLISRELKANKTVTLLVMGATTLLWGFLELAMGIFGEIPTLALFMGNIYFLMLAERRGKRKYFAVAGIFFGFSYLTKTVILIAVLALVLVFASKWLVEKKMKLKDLFLWLGGAVLPVAAFESYKIVQLGIDGYVAFWDNQSGNILKQAGVKEGFADTVGVFQKLWVHLEVYAETFNIQSATIIVLLGFNFVWFVCKAVICGYGWWQAPVISFYAGIDFVDLESLEPIGQGRPVYFVADQAWLVDSGQTEADLPYPVELVYEESHTGQRLYRIK